MTDKELDKEIMTILRKIKDKCNNTACAKCPFFSPYTENESESDCMLAQIGYILGVEPCDWALNELEEILK